VTIADFASPPFALRAAQLGRLFPGRLAPDWKIPEQSAPSRSMEQDDAPILRYLYQAHQPRRHLEFGTWQGGGACTCLEASDATVWTLNLPDGETKPDGTWTYGERVRDESNAPPGAVTANYGTDEEGPRTYHRTDAGGYIGRLYRERSLGHRVCQIYCDSRKWDTSAYPRDFFDSVLIDGGHQAEVVASDTRKALAVLRPGGLVLWHDFCPLPGAAQQFESIGGVTAAIESMLPEIIPQLSALHWINPSWILLGIKK
jgi:hypothetical protein